MVVKNFGKVVEKMYEVLSPLGEPTVEVARPRPPLPNLRGKTICEVTNSSFRSELTFPIIRELLQKRYPDIKVIPYSEFPIQWLSQDTTTIKQRVATAVALMLEKGCDAVITGNGF